MFNHYMLTLARESRGLTQGDLAKQIRMTPRTLSKYETGAARPPEDVIEDLGATLRYPVGFFYQPGHPYGFPPYHYRRRKKLSKKALGKIVAAMNIRRMHI